MIASWRCDEVQLENEERHLHDLSRPTVVIDNASPPYKPSVMISGHSSHHLGMHG